MATALESLKNLEQCALKAIQQAADSAALEDIRVVYIGRKGSITSLLRDIPSLSVEERPLIGREGNRIKNVVTATLAARIEDLSSHTSSSNVDFDCTMPGRKPRSGRVHPLTSIINEIVDIFHGMGFSQVDGPDIETDYYNFEALNFPPDHPARDMQDTFVLGDDRVLRTQTSSVQIRIMEQTKPPVRIIAPGRCYRRDEQDATHSPVFQQIEGLYVDKNVTFAQLKGTLLTFARRMFGDDVQIRFRTGFFPFTEPSAEYDLSCVICKGKGCRVCGGTGWLEISGAGMVDPNVFKSVGYDPEVYSGFAFGMGIERLAMIKYGVHDIRMFSENDMRFLDQF